MSKGPDLGSGGCPFVAGLLNTALCTHGGTNTPSTHTGKDPSFTDVIINGDIKLGVSLLSGLSVAGLRISVVSGNKRWVAVDMLS